MLACHAWPSKHDEERGQKGQKKYKVLSFCTELQAKFRCYNFSHSLGGWGEKWDKEIYALFYNCDKTNFLFMSI